MYYINFVLLDLWVKTTKNKVMYFKSVFIKQGDVAECIFIINMFKYITSRIVILIVGYLLEILKTYF